MQIGDRFGRLTVSGPKFSRKPGKWIRYYAPCTCDCGTEKDVLVGSLKRGSTTSCGCLRREIHTTHGEGDTGKNRLYAVWVSMKQRCTNPKHPQWAGYGGRGIAVCEAWSADYPTFRTWSQENGYTDGLTLDRIDNDKGYSPENCRWVTRLVNNNNTRTNHRIEAFGEEQTLAQWSRDPRCRVGRITLLTRIRRGWDAERAISAPPLW